LINRSILSALMLAALMHCGGDEATPPKAPPAPNPEALQVRGPDDSDDRNNLLNFAHGAVVVSRTGEFGLEASAQLAIDGDPMTAWVSPPDDADQSILFALPAATRIKSLGILAGGEPSVFPKSVVFEVSTDGKSFAPATTLTMKTDGKNVADVAPVEARYIRFNTRGGGHFARAVSIIARGDLLEPVRPGALEGCWSINGLDATFSQNGAFVTGVMSGKTPVTMDGGSDGRFYRLLWLRGPEYGIAGVAVTPDGQHLSGIFWHEESYNRFIGATWFGDRHPCATASRSQIDVMATSMQRYGRYAMYGLQFDDAGHLIENASAAMLGHLVSFLKTSGPVRIEAHELMQSDDAHNKSVSQTKIDTLRAALAHSGANLAQTEFVAVGGDKPHRLASTDAARSIYGAVELIRR
jgi:hypothetical protein